MSNYKGGKITKICNTCNNDFFVFIGNISAKYCSRICVFKSNDRNLKIVTTRRHNNTYKHTETSKEKIRIANVGKKLSIHTLNKLKGKIAWNKGIKMPQLSGPNNHKWIIDRSLLKTSNGSEERRSSKYKDWRRQICNRDNWKCKIQNSDCNGRLEVHHILGFTEYPELKYDINNGICLCHAHHPRKRAEEKRLSPYFMELVSVSK